ncbi:phage tail protein [uncultured Microbulbifer sp.]|uniref:phage tail protein n=1 Tax=uncultured Microbulbifer sp. TaxID=348147 RepID=UPI0026114A60|nr:phage tail protein [uncultured Microbulbifer sp.]
MMMSLGLFAFSLSSAAYQDLQRQTAWRHASSERIAPAPPPSFSVPVMTPLL